MSITDELREWWVCKFPVMDSELHKDFSAIADRIDAEHESACAEAYGNGVMSVPIALDESAWVELPKDADGEYIHIGDVMEGVDKYDSLKKVMGEVTTISFDATFDPDDSRSVGIRVWSDDRRSHHTAYLDPRASVYRHYHAPTVEDVLYESLKHFGAVEERTPEVEEWLHEQAAKLRLAGSDAE